MINVMGLGDLPKLKFSEKILNSHHLAARIPTNHAIRLIHPLPPDAAFTVLLA